jgi:3-hydroxybutyryl-CoA dehydrogenase
MHFFNPAPVLKLVEVVRGEQTSKATIDTLVELGTQMGKTPVLCTDSPGFIVNRVARHYYLEALKLAEQGDTDYDTIDAIMEATGFKMGPFRLMDLIGNDINLAVTRSLYEAFDRPARFEPSIIQEDKVKKGELGKKSGRGYYSYQ